LVRPLNDPIPGGMDRWGRAWCGEGGPGQPPECADGKPPGCDCARADHPARSRGMSEDFDNRIAIVGMAARFPGARDVRAFWTNLLAGTESVQFFRNEELEDSFDA